MAERDVDTHPDAVLADVQPVPVDQVKIPEGQEAYRTEDWEGRPIYICNGCGADTFNKSLVVKHVQRLHR
jgi:hypothetical protein